MIKKTALIILSITLVTWIALATLWGYPLFYYSAFYHKFFPDYWHRQVTLDMSYEGEPVTIRFVARCRQLPRPLLSMRLNYRHFLEKSRLAEMISRWQNGYPTRAFAHIDNPTAYTSDGTLLLARFIRLATRSKLCTEKLHSKSRLRFFLTAYPDPKDVKVFESFLRMTCGESNASDTRCNSMHIERALASTYGAADPFAEQRPATYPKPEHKITFWERRITVIDAKSIQFEELTPVEGKKHIVRINPQKTWRNPTRRYHQLEDRGGICTIGSELPSVQDKYIAVREDEMCAVETRAGLLKPSEQDVREWFYLPSEPMRLARFVRAGGYPSLPWLTADRNTSYLLFRHSLKFKLKYLDTD